MDARPLGVDPPAQQPAVPLDRRPLELEHPHPVVPDRFGQAAQPASQQFERLDRRAAQRLVQRPLVERAERLGHEGRVRPGRERDVQLAGALPEQRRPLEVMADLTARLLGRLAGRPFEQRRARGRQLRGRFFGRGRPLEVAAEVVERVAPGVLGVRDGRPSALPIALWA